MFYRCLTCQAPFPLSSALEHFPIGRRIAYDPERGRLWAVCDACGAWTLAPFEERWEALEELERRVTAVGGLRPRPAGQTDNISRYRVGPIEVIRVGRSDLVEEAAWRYGRSSARTGSGEPHPFGRRPLRLGEWFSGAAYVVRARVAGQHGIGGADGVRQWLLFGDTAWRGRRECPACAHPITEMSYFEGRSLIIRAADTGSFVPSLVLACTRCRDEVTGGLHLDGTAAEFVLRRVLAHSQHQGISPERVRSASHLIRGAGGASGLCAIAARYGRYLSDLPGTTAVALRVLANAAYEERLLGLEVKALERQWRREEELASIVDGELTRVGGG
jgi:hypothetical protein